MPDPSTALCRRCQQGPADAADDDVVEMDVAPSYGGLIPHMPCPGSLGPVEPLAATADGVPRIRRFDSSFGWYTYYGDTLQTNPAVMFHPLPSFPFSLVKLKQVESKYPAEITPEFEAMLRYAVYRNGEFPSNKG